MNLQVDLLTRAHHKPTILVTGGSGVIGSTLLPRLTGGALRPEVIALVHRRDIHQSGVSRHLRILQEAGLSFGSQPTRSALARSFSSARF